MSPKQSIGSIKKSHHVNIEQTASASNSEQKIKSIEEVDDIQLKQKDIVLHADKQDIHDDSHELAFNSPWISGLFYITLFFSILCMLAILANILPFYSLVVTLVVGFMFVLLIGILQLRQDNMLSDKNFFESLKLVVAQLPLISRIIKNKSANS